MGSLIRRARTTHAGLSSLLLVTCLTGCGGGGPQTYSLRGTVTCDGKAVPTGWVTFLSKNKHRHTAEIDANGQFQIELPAGEHQIGVFAPRESGKTGVEAFQERPMPPYVPAHYGQPEHSGLSATITEDSENEPELALTSKPRRR